MKLIALAVIAAGLIAADSLELAEGVAFEAPDDKAAELIAAGLAKEDVPAAPVAPKGKSVKARLLVDCEYGKANDVVTLPAADAKAAEASGVADTSKPAVDYALTLEQNQPKA